MTTAGQGTGYVIRLTCRRMTVNNDLFNYYRYEVGKLTNGGLDISSLDIDGRKVMCECAESPNSQFISRSLSSEFVPGIWQDIQEAQHEADLLNQCLEVQNS